MLVSRALGYSVGYLYPAYATFKALKHPTDSQDPRPLREWLTYWVVLSLFGAAEGIAAPVTQFFPFYNEVKLSFLVWLQSPVTRGASMLYNTYIHPWLEEHEDDIDRAAWDIADRGRRAISDAIAFGIAELARAIEETVRRIEEDHRGNNNNNNRRRGHRNNNNNNNNRAGNNPPRQTATVEVLDGRESSS